MCRELRQKAEKDRMKEANALSEASAAAARAEAAELAKALAERQARQAQINLIKEQHKADQETKKLTDKLDVLRMKPLWQIRFDEIKCVDTPRLFLEVLDSLEGSEVEDEGDTRYAEWYAEHHQLGTGSYGAVYLARLHGFLVAVKWCNPLPAVWLDGKGKLHGVELAKATFDQEMDNMHVSIDSPAFHLSHPSLLGKPPSPSSSG